MNVHIEDDEARIEAVRRWHIFNRDPSDEHWRNIDSLLHLLGIGEARLEALRDSEHEMELEVHRLENRCAKLEKFAFSLARRVDGERGAEALSKTLSAI